MRAKDLMTTEVWTVGPGHSIRHAARIMLKRGVSGLPVVDGSEAVVGVITEGDLLRRVELGNGTPARAPTSSPDRDGPLHAYVKENAWSVGDVMSTKVISAGEEMPVEEIAATMIANGVKRLPVISDGRLVGIVSRADLLWVITWVEPEQAIRGDEALCRSVKARLSVRGLLRDVPELTVSNAVVHLWGGRLTEAERDVVRIVAEATPGTAGFVDHIVSGILKQ